MNNLQYFTKRTLKLKHGVELTDPQLETIDQIYTEFRRKSVADVAFYRMINFAIGVFGMLFYLIISGTGAGKWFFIGFAGLFSFYNLIHAIFNFSSMNRLKRRQELVMDIKRSSEE